MIIYMASNKVNGKRYIGQSVQSLSDRRYSHLARARGPSKHRFAFHHAMAKYGPDSFTWEVLEETDEAGLDMAERFWIRCYGSLSPGGYNLVTGGHTNRTVSATTRRKMSDGKKLSQSNTDHCRALALARRGTTATASTRAKMSDKRTGIARSDQTKARMALARSGEQTNLAKLNWDKVTAIRETYAAGGTTYQSLANEYGVSVGNISLIINEKTWQSACHKEQALTIRRAMVLSKCREQPTHTKTNRGKND